jgi:hypothetical protein
LASGTGDQLFRDERGRDAGDLAQDEYCLVSSTIANPEHGWLGSAAVSAGNGRTGVGPPGLGQAEPLMPRAHDVGRYDGP